MKKRILFTNIFALLFSFLIHAQTLEKVHEISGSSKRGNIADVIYYPASENIELKYMHNTTVNGEALYESYIYNKQFELVDNTSEKGPIVDLASKNENNNYRGESYSVKGVKMGYNLSLNLELALIQTETNYTYSWEINDYIGVTRDVQKTTLMPNDAAGYVGHLGVEDLHDGGGLFVTSLRDKIFGKGTDRYMQYKKFRFIKMDDDMNMVNETKLDLDKLHEMVYQKAIYDESGIAAMPKLKGVALILAPVFAKGITPKAANQWSFIFLDNKGNIAKNLSFKVPSTRWDISDIVYDQSKDEFYVYGPANKSVNKKGVMKYYKNLNAQSSSSMYIGGEKKYSMLQIMKVQGGEVIYCTNESLDEMAAKTYNLKGLVKRRIYKARKFETMGVNYMSNGDFMIYGTNYGKKDSLGVKSNYRQAVTIHFDKNGGVKKIYAISPYETNYQSVPMTNTIINDKAGKYMYWILEENAGVKSSLTVKGETNMSYTGFSYSGSFVWKYKYLLYPRVIKIDLENATMKEFIPGNKKYFLDNKYPFIQTPKEDFIFFGADKSGKRIWFNQLSVD